MPVANDAVSVVMPVRNAMPFLDAAIESILAQTHENFELIIGDDGSTDGSGECLERWARRDPRIRLLRHDGPGLGLAGSSNWVTRHARHPLIARMDADDVAMPGRLRAQVQTFREHPDTAVVGSLCDYIDANGRRMAGRDRSGFRNKRCVFPCAHGSLMFRREIFERVGGYRPQCDYWEDVDLFLRIEREGPVLTLSEVLYRYRISPTSSRHVSDEARVARALELCVQCVAAESEGRDYEALIEEHRHTPRASGSRCRWWRWLRWNGSGGGSQGPSSSPGPGDTLPLRASPAASAFWFSSPGYGSTRRACAPSSS